MYTFLNFKRNTAVVIFLAFVVRLYVLCVCAGASPDTTQSRYSPKHLPSGVYKKRRRIADEILAAGVKKYSAVEIFEEDSDSEKEFRRTNSPALLPFVYSLFRGFVHAPELRYWFDSVTANVLPRNYLAFSILRI